MEGVINTVVWAAIIQGLLLGMLYVFSKKYRSFANRLLGFFLFALIIEALNVFIPIESVGGYSLWYYFELPEVKLFFPLFFVHFVLEKVGQAAKYRLFLRIHYGLALGIAGITLVNLLLFFLTGKSMVDYLGNVTMEGIFMTQQTYAFLLTIVAFGIAIRETLQYRERARNEYSDYTMLEISWLWQFIFTMIPIALLWGAEILRVLLGGIGLSDIVLFTWGLVVLFIYFVSYKAFRFPNLFEGIPQIAEEEMGKKAPLVDENPNFEALSQKIQSAMEAEKYYLNQNLTIYELAKEMNLSSRAISTCINRDLGYNFSEWVNNYRVDHAMALLADPQSNHLSIEGVGSEAGFKSRSAMYTAFKKKTGQAPGYFRQTSLS
jgi:AraC-like DNA-binding protein